MEKKRFIFDLDGTLLTGDFSLEEQYFKSIYHDRCYQLFGHIGEYLDEYECSYNHYDKEMLSAFLTRKSGLEITPNIIDGWINIPWQVSDRMEEGVLEVLDYLKGRGYSLAVLSNWFLKTQVERLKSAGLYEFFDEVIAEVSMKPHPDSYYLAKGRFQKGDCLFIGDNLEKDYMGPRKCGMDSILYDKEDKYSKKLVKVKSMREFIQKY